MRAAVSETFPEPNRRLLQRLVYFFFTGIYVVFEFLFSFYLMVYDPEQYILDYIPLSAQVYDQHFSLSFGCMQLRQQIMYIFAKLI